MKHLYNKKIYNYITIVLLLIDLSLLFLLFIGLNKSNLIYNLILVIIFLLFINEFLFSCFVKLNLINLIFIPPIVLFLMGRPLLLLSNGKVWYIFGEDIAIQYLLIMFTSVLGIIVGKYLKMSQKSYFKKSNKISSDLDRKLKYLKNINVKFAVKIGFFISFSSYLIVKIIEFMNMYGKSYLEYYLGTSQSNIPWIVIFLSSLSLFFMSFYLAYTKDKKSVILVLLLYVGSTIPTLLIGQRNPFILSILFAISMIYLKNEKEWKIKINTKKISLLIGFLGIFSILLMSFVSNSRNNESKNGSIINTGYNFIYDQGTTFETLCIGISHKKTLRTAENNNYTFSAIIDYFKYGKIGNILLNTEPLPGGNNVQRVCLSNDLAHKLSYIALKDNYLNGAGIGTTYVLETYIDFGLVGVFLINCFYSFYCSLLYAKFGKNLLLDVIFVYSLTKIYFIGRDNAIIPFSGMVTLHFIFVVILIYLSSYLIMNHEEKKYEK